MKINVVNPHGFCLGVDRAVKLAQNAALKNPNNTYLLGEIVHNSFVISDADLPTHFIDFLTDTVLRVLL